MKDPIERADAIAALDDEITITGTANAFVVKDYVQRVLRKLRDLPSAQPPTDEWCTDCKEYDKEKHCCPRFNRVIRETLKETQPQRMKAHWVDITNAESIDYEYKCSECGFHLFLWSDLTNYCPNCGARMDGGEQDV